MPDLEQYMRRPMNRVVPMRDPGPPRAAAWFQRFSDVGIDYLHSEVSATLPHGGFNYYRSNLSVTSDPWTDLDRTVSDLPVTMLWGMGDPVVPPSLVDQIPTYYANYTMQFVEDGGHFMMVEKPDVVIDQLTGVPVTSW